MEPDRLIHHYCAYHRDSRLEFGWIRALQKNRLAVQPVLGREQFLPTNRILWSQPSQQNAEYGALQQLNHILEEAEVLAEQIDLPTIHALVEPGSESTLAELAQDFLEKPEALDQQIALLLVLQNTEDWFRRNRKNTYTPLTEEEQQQLQQRREREMAHKQREANVRMWVKELELGNWPNAEEQTQNQRDWVEQLRSLLFFGRDSGYWKELAPWISLGASHGQADEQQLRRLLQKAGQPVSWGELQLRKAQITLNFPDEALQAAEVLHQQTHTNFSNLPEERPVFTIDAAKTRDYDDAISVKSWTERSIELSVHIADLTQHIDPEDALFSLAEQRISSVYTVEDTYPMLPEILANDHFSLRANVSRAVMSFNLQLFLDGTCLLHGIEHEQIIVQQNLTYDEVDTFVEQQDSFWEILFKCCDSQRKLRLANGALDIERKEFELDITDPANIHVLERDRESPANSLVQELAILVNRLAGEQLERTHLPGIFRTQAPYEITKEPAEGEKLTMDHVNIEGARLAVNPGTHSGLGCSVYMQVTSPIRRFVDLLCQWQLRNALQHQQALFSEQQLMGWASEIELRQRFYARTEREIERYWKLRYVGQHLGQVFAARVRRELNQRVEIELEDIGLVCQLPGSHPKGTQLGIEVLQVDSEGGNLFGEFRDHPGHANSRE